MITRCVILGVLAGGLVAWAGCAGVRGQAPVPPREATEAERREIAAALAPLLVVSGMWRGPQDGCAAALAIVPGERINLGVGPSRTCTFSLIITEGALRALPPDELQAALAHELGHVQLGHFHARAERRQAERERQRAIESRGSTAGALATAVPVIGPLLAIGIASGQTAAQVATESTYRAYDRGEETAADRFATDLLRSLVGGSARCLALVRLLERLDGDRGAALRGDWLATHPAPARRIEAVRAACAA